MGGVAPAAVPGGAEAPVPQRRELGIPDQLPDFLHGLHAGDHHTLGTHVQQPQHCRAGDLIGPGQGRQACALGGTSLAGGKGSELGTILGVFTVAIIENGMNFIGVNAYYQNIVFGIFVLAAIALTVDRSIRGQIVK